MKTDKQKLLLIVIPVILAIVVVIIGITSIFGGIKQTTDTITHEAGRELLLDATKLFDIDEETAAKVTFDTSGVDVKKVGSYELTAKYNGKTYEFKVEVVDTAAASIEFAQRYVFTNDIGKADLTSMIDIIYDASEYTLKLVRFEKSGTLSVMDEKALDTITKSIPLPCNEEQLLALGTEDVPTEQGVYRSVLEIKDAYDNVRYEEVYVILDKTGAYIDEVIDMEVTVAKGKLEEKPVLDMSKFTITDNVDGMIKAENIKYELEVDNKENHTWMATVSYTDRAGNESSMTFLVAVKEGDFADDSDNENSGTTNNGATNDGSSNNGTTNNGTVNNGGTNQGNTNNQNSNQTPSGNTQTGNGGTNNGSADNGSSNNGGTNQGNTNNQTPSGNTNSGNNNQSSNDEQKYDPADTNKDGVVDGEEAYKNISVYEQMAIDAGYGNVVDFGNGNYAVLTHEDDLINGKHAATYLREWLAERDLEPTRMAGAVINYDNDWFWWIAYDTHELINEDDEEFWD